MRGSVIAESGGVPSRAKWSEQEAQHEWCVIDKGKHSSFEELKGTKRTGKPRCGNNLNIHRQMVRYIKCATDI